MRECGKIGFCGAVDGEEWHPFFGSGGDVQDQRTWLRIPGEMREENAREV